MTKNLGLATDLYQLTMAAGYLANGRNNDVASFELFVRKFPANRSYLVLAGIQQALEYLQNLRFSEVEITYLKSLPVFAHVAEDFFAYLRNFRFSGEVWAMQEGTIFFPNEPILRITAPLIEAQIVETFLLATINFQTMIASKAARIVEAAQGKSVVEFGTRRAHGMDAGLHAARAAFIAGCVGTSNVEAGMTFGIPVFGTAAHSWVMSFADEFESFKSFHEVFPEHTTLLIDTYDTINAAQLATKIGASLKGVRIDSGDLLLQSKQVRTILDEAGLQATKIMVSGDLDEFKIAELLANNAPIDSFGVGTDLSTSRDAPALAGVYKLVELNGEPKQKLSEGKTTIPYCKQVWRKYDESGLMLGDEVKKVMSKSDEGKALLQIVMQNGEAIKPYPSLSDLQIYCQKQMKALPENHSSYPINFESMNVR